METIDLVRHVSPKINQIGNKFYFDPATLARGKELGLDGFRFYVLGRGGVLGDVEPAVIQSAFGWFAPELVARMWTSATETLPPREGGRAYLECCQELGRTRFADLDGLDEFNAAAQAVVAAAHPAGLSLFAGLAAEPLADDAPARAMQLVATLREHRGSAHLIACVAAGLDVQIAHIISRGEDDARMFGYADPLPTPSDEDRAMASVDAAATDRMLVRPYRVLDDARAEAMAATVDAMEAVFAE